MSATPDSTLANPRDHLIADLQRRPAECAAERDEALAQQTPSEKPGQTKSYRSQLVPLSRPNPGPARRTAATLSDSVRGTPVRQTLRWRGRDSNPRSRSSTTP